MKIILLFMSITFVSCSSIDYSNSHSYKLCLSQAKVMLEKKSLEEQRQYCKEEITRDAR